MEFIVKFSFGGKILDVRANCGDCKGLDENLVMQKLEAQVLNKFPGAVILCITPQH